MAMSKVFGEERRGDGENWRVQFSFFYCCVAYRRRIIHGRPKRAARSRRKHTRARLIKRRRSGGAQRHLHRLIIFARIDVK